MPTYWLVKSEPQTYSLEDLQREGVTRWEGVRNAAALGHLRSMRKGDEVLVYHSGSQKAVVGVAKVAKGPYADPKANDPKLVVVDLSFVRAFENPVPLSLIKGDSRFKEFPLVRIGRLSVMPVREEWWNAILRTATQG